MTVTSTAFGGSCAAWTSWITRPVASMSTRMMMMGTAVHAASSWTLPYTWGGSWPGCPGAARNRTTLYPMSPATTTNTAALSQSTIRARPAMVSAGVDTGAKMLETVSATAVMVASMPRSQAVMSAGTPAAGRVLFSTTTSLIRTMGVMPVKLRMSAPISLAWGPNAAWYAATESHIRWHMATYAGGVSGAPPPSPLSIV